mmetsp:Transcript_14908/g.27961  ORF Transcript_14908/g.27961 Transcript_14908/m.27961 type:complete len:99 (-) Transcript_14908:8-304(-)
MSSGLRFLVIGDEAASTILFKRSSILLDLLNEALLDRESSARSTLLLDNIMTNSPTPAIYLISFSFYSCTVLVVNGSLLLSFVQWPSGTSWSITHNDA